MRSAERIFIFFVRDRIIFQIWSNSKAYGIVITIIRDYQLNFINKKWSNFVENLSYSNRILECRDQYAKKTCFLIFKSQFFLPITV